MKVSLKAFRARAVSQQRAGAQVLEHKSWSTSRASKKRGSKREHHIVQDTLVDVAPSSEHQPSPLPAAEEADAGTPSTSGSNGTDDVLKLTALLPLTVRARLDAHPQLAELLEVRQRRWSCTLWCRSDATPQEWSLALLLPAHPALLMPAPTPSRWCSTWADPHWHVSLAATSGWPRPQ